MIRGFIKVATEAGPILLGIAQIVSISHGLTKRGRSTDIRMGDGSTCVALGSVDDVLDLIEEAEADDLPALQAQAHPIPNPDGSYNVEDVLVPKTSAIATPAPQAEVKAEPKKRGRPPKATPQQ